LKLLVAHPQGTIYEHPYLHAAAWSGQEWLNPVESGYIPLPEGTKLFTLPQRLPVGYNPHSGKYEVVRDFSDGKTGFQPWAVSAFLPPAYMRLLLPAYSTIVDAPALPQWAYAAVAAGEKDILTAAMKVDASERWHPRQFDDRQLPKRMKEITGKYPHNRLIQHISHCATQYHCFAAKNFFLARWEAGLPAARKCNAACLGCLSLQSGEVPSSHQRISFTPTVEEIAEAAVHHLQYAEDPLVSFGQGCEGDPLMEWQLIVEAVKLIRKRTERGTIHLNTNGSIPEAAPALADAGVDSVRVSLNSANKENYRRYFRPEGYSLEEVKEFLKRSKQAGLFLHINLLIMPGFSDSVNETESFIHFAEALEIDLAQLKNLNLDPELYLREMVIDSPAQGMMNMWNAFKARLPKVKYGYFNLQKERF